MKSIYCVILAVLVAACGPSPAELSATVSAAQLQTRAAAPTATLTKTPSPVPTATPTRTPTSPPTDTPTPSNTPLPTPFGGGQGHIAFALHISGNNDEIFVVDSDGTNLTALTNHPAQDNFPKYSPDGSLIAFVSSRDGDRNNVDLFVMNADGANLVKVTAQTGHIKPGVPFWSTDGQRLAVFQQDGTVVIVSLDGTSVETATDLTGKWHFGNRSADGQQSAEPCQYPQWGDICLNVAGSNQIVNITNNPSRTPVLPAWSPDGTRLVFIADYGPDKGGLYTIQPDGSDLRLLASFPINEVTQLVLGSSAPS